MGATNKERLEAFRRAVARVVDPGFRRALASAMADAAHPLILADMDRSYTARSGKLRGGTTVSDISDNGFRMRSKEPYAGTLNWGSNRIIRKRYARHVAPGIIRFVKGSADMRSETVVLASGSVGRKRTNKGGTAMLDFSKGSRGMPNRPGVFLLVMRQKYRKHTFIPVSKLPKRWLDVFESIVKEKLRFQIMSGWS